MMRSLIAVALVLACSVANAQNAIVIDGNSLGNGEYFFSVKVSNGAVSVTQLPVWEPDTIPHPGDPGPKPGDPVDSDLARKTVAWLATVPQYNKRAEHVALVAMVYNTVLAEPRLNGDGIMMGISEGTDAVLGADAGKWRQFRSGVSAYLTEQSRKGHLSQRSDYAQYLGEVAKVLERSSPNALGDGRLAELFRTVIWPILLKIILAKLGLATL